MILIVSALASELPEGFGRTDDHPAPLITGVGKINAAVSLARWLETGPRPDAVVNLGSGGGVKLSWGQLIQVNSFHQYDMRCEGLGLDRGVTPFDQSPAILRPTHRVKFPDLHPAPCYSSDRFLDDARRQPPGPSVIDMEAYALAKVCQAFDMPFASIKYITDGADGSSGTDWRAALQACAQVLGTVARDLNSAS